MRWISPRLASPAPFDSPLAPRNQRIVVSAGHGWLKWCDCYRSVVRRFNGFGLTSLAPRLVGCFGLIVGSSPSVPLLLPVCLDQNPAELVSIQWGNNPYISTDGI